MHHFLRRGRKSETTASHSDQIALVTGSTDGIGKQTALELGQLGYQVFVHARSQERGQAALADLRQQAPGARFELAVAYLASLAQVRRMADDLKARVGRLDVLLNNAGVKPLTRVETEDGLELTFAVNHLSHFLLTRLLLDRLHAAPQGRVITVSSMVHHNSRMHFDDLQFVRGWDSGLAYAQSKLANVLFAFGLARRLAGTAVTSNAVHPGVVTTKLLIEGFGVTGGNLADGALANVHAATAPELATVSGQYSGVGRERPNRAALDVRQQDRLWTISEQLAGLQMPQAQA